MKFPVPGRQFPVKEKLETGDWKLATYLSPRAHPDHPGARRLQRFLILHDRIEQRFSDLLSVRGVLQQLAFLPVRQERNLCEHTGHRRANQDDEWRLLDPEIAQLLVARAQ